MIIEPLDLKFADLRFQVEKKVTVYYLKLEDVAF